MNLPDYRSDADRAWLSPVRWLALGLALAFCGGMRMSASAGGADGTVFLDRNGNSIRDAGEPGLPDVVVSDQDDVAITGADGSFHLTGAASHGIVFVSVPDGYRSVGAFWQRASGNALAFALTPAPAPAEFSFIHASDTHLSEASLARTVRLRQIVNDLRPAMVLVSGDLVRDALRVSEEVATSYYRMYVHETSSFGSPVWSVPGNHEIFGIERQLSHVSPSNPLYAKAMYRSFLGPDYYSFTFGGIHFVGLNTVDYDDQSYYGHVDETQLAWLERDLARTPPAMPVVTFNHIPFFSSGETLGGYMDGPPAPTPITVGGRTVFRHVVSNAEDVLRVLRRRPYPLALGGHFHIREMIQYAADGVQTRFYQTAAVVGPSDEAGMRLTSGVTLYHVRAGVVDDGRFIPLDENASGQH